MGVGTERPGGLGAMRNMLRIGALVLLGSAPAWSIVTPAPAGSPLATTAPDSAVADDDTPLYAVPTQRDRAGRLIAPVYINGRGPFRFLLDTGATHTAITVATAEQLGLIPDASARSSVQGVSGHVIVPRVYVEALVAGALRLDKVLVPCLSGSALDGLDGVLGMDGLENLKVTADFARDQVLISRSTGRQAGHGYAVVRGRLVSNRLFMVDARIAGIPVKAIFDTGASHTLGNPALLAELAKRRNFRIDAPIASVTDATATLQQGEIHLTPRIDLAGGTDIRNTDVTFSDFAVFKAWGLENQPAVLVGMDVLSTVGEFTIDLRRKELLLRKPERRLPRRI
jgi:predicted aspartyl protease